MYCADLNQMVDRFRNPRRKVLKRLKGFQGFIFKKYSQFLFPNEIYPFPLSSSLHPPRRYFLAAARFLADFSAPDALETRTPRLWLARAAETPPELDQLSAGSAPDSGVGR